MAKTLRSFLSEEIVEEDYQFLIEGSGHLEHIEDLVLNNGVNGARQAINFLRYTRDMLAGHSKKAVNLSMKIDGCLHAETVVITDQGPMTIEQIAKSWHINKQLFVLGKAEDQEIWVPITDCFVTTSEKQWVEVQLEHGVLVATEDHLIKTTNRGWVAAGELTPDDDIEISEKVNIDDGHLTFTNKENNDAEETHATGNNQSVG